MPLAEQDGFEHGQQGIGGTTTVVSKVTGSLTIQVLFDWLPINHLIQLQQWKTVDVFGNHGLGGLLEEGGHGKSPKCLGGNLGDFGEFCKGLNLLLEAVANPFMHRYDINRKEMNEVIEFEDIFSDLDELLITKYRK